MNILYLTTLKIFGHPTYKLTIVCRVSEYVNNVAKYIA